MTAHVGWAKPDLLADALLVFFERLDVAVFDELEQPARQWDSKTFRLCDRESGRTSSRKVAPHAAPSPRVTTLSDIKFNSVETLWTTMSTVPPPVDGNSIAITSIDDHQDIPVFRPNSRKGLAAVDRRSLRLQNQSQLGRDDVVDGPSSDSDSTKVFLCRVRPDGCAQERGQFITGTWNGQAPLDVFAHHGASELFLRPHRRFNLALVPTARHVAALWSFSPGLSSNYLGLLDGHTVKAAQIFGDNVEAIHVGRQLDMPSGGGLEAEFESLVKLQMRHAGREASRVPCGGWGGRKHSESGR
ncbi:hypothetical protein BDK51DRAFT_42776 [Blyttiomyces helicus]|uniref:Uncharacterized protein n=1 Tax=Blyttiomyces helicus TaxID=388810 RepID=A0A4P9WN52_9FUNG|nr:hypothetical protein BDK51DRAFT_42776 [Blyttiomyces helicus]|eukprot:RKO92640.1 hypothetical protein BDK51DRAFT_42776 [Blyttiomyces helicus]